MTPKKVLIISYHALPFDVVASYRTKAYTDYFSEHNLQPTLITHRWEKNAFGTWLFHNKRDDVIEEKTNNYRVIRLPRPKEAKSPNIFFTVFHWLKGNFDLHLNKSYQIFKEYIFKHLETNNYDLVISIFSPHYHLKLAYEIKKKFHIPYILDFRDLWDNQMVTDSYSPSFKKKVQDKFLKYYWSQWLNNCLFFSTTSDKWLNFLQGISKSKGIKVRNGHELKRFHDSTATDKFRIAYFGRLYPYQELDLMIDGINKFISNNKSIKDFEILLIGIKNVGEFDGAAIFEKKINNKFLKKINYLPKAELLSLAKRKVNLFILPNLKEDNGSFFVKLFDYIALKKPVILAPANGSENDEIIKNTSSGLVSSSATEIAEFLSKSYWQFKKYGQIQYEIKENHIAGLHRSKQIEFLADKIRKHLP